MENINLFIDKLIHNEVTYNDISDKLDDPREYFEERYDGFLDSAKLSFLLDYGRHNKELWIILSGLLYFSNKDSISDEIFKKLLKFPKNMRRTVFVALAHCDISFYQLMAINKMKICFEAFGWLMHHMYTLDAFSTEDIMQLLKDSAYIQSTWKDTFRQLLSSEQESSRSKKELLVKLISEPTH